MDIQQSTIEHAATFFDLVDQERARRRIAEIDFDQEFEAWFLHNPAIHTTSRETYMYYWKHWQQFLGDAPIYPITVADVDQFYAALKSQSLADNTINTIINVISSFYTWLWRRQRIPENPFRHLIRSRQKAKKDPDRIPNSDDILFFQEALIHSMRCIRGTGSTNKRRGAKKLYLQIAFMATYGCRISSFSTLRLRGETVMWSSKTKDYIEPLTDDLKALCAWYGIDNGIIFPQSKRNSVEIALMRFCHAHGLSGFSPHSFRHYVAIWHYMQHHDVKYVQGLLGHEDLRTTQIYLDGLAWKHPRFHADHWFRVSWLVPTF